MLEFNVDRFGVAIEFGCKLFNLSMTDLEALTSIPRSTLYQLRSGTIAPSMAQFTKICDTFELSPESFFKGAKNGTSKRN